MPIEAAGANTCPSPTHAGRVGGDPETPGGHAGLGLPAPANLRSQLSASAGEYCRSRTYISFSIVIGRSRTRLPVAWNTALAMAAAAPTTPISPTVLPPRALA
jgi:hypothetical protein